MNGKASSPLLLLSNRYPLSKDTTNDVLNAAKFSPCNDNETSINISPKMKLTTEKLRTENEQILIPSAFAKALKSPIYLPNSGRNGKPGEIT